MPDTDDWTEKVERYYRYMDLLEIRRKMKRKKDRRYRRCLAILKKLGVRDKDEKRIGRAQCALLSIEISKKFMARNCDSSGPFRWPGKTFFF